MFERSITFYYLYHYYYLFIIIFIITKSLSYIYVYVIKYYKKINHLFYINLFKMSFHINAKLDDFANVVLMPGDPLRAKWIAENYLTDAKLVNDVRGIYAYTGVTKNGKKLSVMASGMGQPSIGIYSHELYSTFGVDTIIRVGTCGSYQDYINLRDILIVTAACTDGSWYKQYGVPQFSATSDFELAMEAYNVSKKLNIPAHTGTVLSTDIFYNDNKEQWKKWANLNVLGVEMEAYALFSNAQRLKKRALTILTVTDSFIKEGILSSEEKRAGLKNMMDIAIETAEKFAK